MKKFLLALILLSFNSSIVFAQEQYIHPIDKKEETCKQNSQSLEEWTKCSYDASKAWNIEVDKYYSLLHKKLPKEEKTILYENQKYWTLCKNNEIKLINSLYNEETETKERLIYRTTQKKQLIKNRAIALRNYYILTFPDDDQEKIQKNIEYNPDNIIMRSLRYLSF